MSEITRIRLSLSELQIYLLLSKNGEVLRHSDSLCLTSFY